MNGRDGSPQVPYFRAPLRNRFLPFHVSVEWLDVEKLIPDEAETHVHKDVCELMPSGDEDFACGSDTGPKVHLHPSPLGLVHVILHTEYIATREPGTLN